MTTTRDLAANTLASICREASKYLDDLANGVEDPVRDLKSLPTIIEMRLTKVQSDIDRAAFQTKLLR